jgi:hypothetical protein
MMEKVQKPVILCVIHHRQNPLESTLLGGIKSPEVPPEIVKRAEESIGNADV